jgi:hypothetical protein
MFSARATVKDCFPGVEHLGLGAEHGEGELVSVPARARTQSIDLLRKY